MKSAVQQGSLRGANAHFSSSDPQPDAVPFVAPNGLTENTTVDDTTRVVVGVVTAVAAFVCLVVDGSVGFLLQKLRPLNGSFAVLYLSMVTFECINLVIFLCWNSVIVITNNEELGSSYLGRKIGHFIYIVWNTIEFIMVAIAINRYVAIVHPLSYDTMFTRNRGIGLVVLCVVLAYLNQILHVFEGCFAVVSPQRLGVEYSFNTCGVILWWHCIAACSCAIAVLVVANLLTLKQMRKNRKIIAPSGTTTKTMNIETMGDAEKGQAIQKKKAAGMSREVRFFVQAALNALFFEGTVVSFHIVSLWFPTPLGYFIFTNAPLLLTHGSNGFIMIAVNKEFRKSVKDWVKSFWN